MVDGWRYPGACRSGQEPLEGTGEVASWLGQRGRLTVEDVAVLGTLQPAEANGQIAAAWGEGAVEQRQRERGWAGMAADSLAQTKATGPLEAGGTSEIEM